MAGSPIFRSKRYAAVFLGPHGVLLLFAAVVNGIRLIGGSNVLELALFIVATLAVVLIRYLYGSIRAKWREMWAEAFRLMGWNPERGVDYMVAFFVCWCVLALLSWSF